MTLECLAGLRVALHGPVVDRGLGHQGQSVQGYPLPEYHVLCHRVRLHLRLHLDVEDLQGLLSCGRKRAVKIVGCGYVGAQ